MRILLIFFTLVFFSCSENNIQQSLFHSVDDKCMSTASEVMIRYDDLIFSMAKRGWNKDEPMTLDSLLNYYDDMCLSANPSKTSKYVHPYIDEDICFENDIYIENAAIDLNQVWTNTDEERTYAYLGDKGHILDAFINFKNTFCLYEPR